jgi:indolepyruvate decarboxylase
MNTTTMATRSVKRPSALSQPTVADYIVRRLAREGITDCFGVAGDFAFNLDDAVAGSEAIRWIGCSNELDASYAADGYARVRGCALLLTTYAVGELSALNGVMGAKAERSCVFHLVGMPSMRNQRVGKVIHHTLGDGVFQNFANISAQAACVSAVITPDNCIQEMERLIATARAESRPAYILVASDYAITPVTATDPILYPKPVSSPDLAKSVAAITERIHSARSVAVLPAYTVSRFKLQDKLQLLIEALGCPFAVMPMEKGVLSETHPQFVGTYGGGGSSSHVLEAIEDADLVIDAGGVNFNEINTGAYSNQLAPEKLLTIAVDHVRIGIESTTPCVWAMSLKCWPGRFARTSDTRRRLCRPRGSRAESLTTRLLRRNCTRAIEIFSSRWIELSLKAAALVRGSFRSRFLRAQRRTVQSYGARSAGRRGPHLESPWPTRRDGLCFLLVKVRTS